MALSAGAACQILWGDPGVCHNMPLQLALLSSFYLTPPPPPLPPRTHLRAPCVRRCGTTAWSRRTRAAAMSPFYILRPARLRPSPGPTSAPASGRSVPQPPSPPGRAAADSAGPHPHRTAGRARSLTAARTRPAEAHLSPPPPPPPPPPPRLTTATATRRPLHCRKRAYSRLRRPPMPPPTPPPPPPQARGDEVSEHGTTLQLPSRHRAPPPPPPTPGQALGGLGKAAHESCRRPRPAQAARRTPRRERRQPRHVRVRWPGLGTQLGPAAPPAHHTVGRLSARALCSSLQSVPAPPW